MPYINNVADLAREIEQKYHFCVIQRSDFDDIFSFTHQKGRIIPCSGQNCGKSFWIQDCATKYIIGLWSGITYHCDEKSDVLKLVQSLLSDPHRTTPHYSIPNEYKLDSVREFDDYYLVDKDIFLDGRENISKGISIPKTMIFNFFAENNIDFHSDSSGWVSFQYGQCGIFFRLSEEEQVDPNLSLFNIGVEKSCCNDVDEIEYFLSEFPQFLSKSGFSVAGVAGVAWKRKVFE